MELYLTTKNSTVDVTQLMASVVWSGDKSSISRKVAGTILYQEGRGWPEPELGDVLTLRDGDTLFTGHLVKRTLTSDATTMNFTAYDRGIYLRNNDGTYKFRNVAAEGIAATVCADRGIQVMALASTGALLTRKFSAVSLDKIIRTAYSLAADATGERYVLRMRPAGLEVKRLEQSAASLNLRPRSNLMNATTTESIENMVNSVAIYDETGAFLRRVGDQDASDLYGAMERHLTDKGDGVDSKATAMLADGAMAQTVSVEVLGDIRLITGETVIAEDTSAGLKGLFWIDADTHTWKGGIHTTKLTLNCRGVMATAGTGSSSL